MNQPPFNTATPVHSTMSSNTATPPNTATPVQPTMPSHTATSVHSTMSSNTATPVHPTVLTQHAPPHPSMPAQCTDKTPAKRKQATTPGKGLQSKRACNPRRGIHFQNVMGDSSNDEDSDGSDEDWNSMSHEGFTSSSSCCKEQKLENEALRKRLAKVHRRLNIACKSMSVTMCSPQ